jgi:hypothetical protein
VLVEVSIVLLALLTRKVRAVCSASVVSMAQMPAVSTRSMMHKGLLCTIKHDNLILHVSIFVMYNVCHSVLLLVWIWQI